MSLDTSILVKHFLTLLHAKHLQCLMYKWGEKRSVNKNCVNDGVAQETSRGASTLV